MKPNPRTKNRGSPWSCEGDGPGAGGVAHDAAGGDGAELQEQLAQLGVVHRVRHVAPQVECESDA